MWASGVKGGINVGPSFSSYLKATFNNIDTLVTRTWTKLPFTAVEYDNDSEVDIVTNGRWNVAASGFYRLVAAAAFVAIDEIDAIGVNIAIRKNGTQVERGTNGINASQADDKTTAIHATCLQLTAGDYIEVWGYHNHGSDRSTWSIACYMTAERFA